MKYRKKPVVIEAEQYIPGITTPFLKEANMIPIDSDTDWECKGCKVVGNAVEEKVYKQELFDNSLPF